ncbi:hypothetical protein [Kluyvera intermedia]|uniref:hypothetical protein n=1 Tax=Kluyvera intermedia TaxID=61648 RepID=UPI0035254D49
MAITLSQAMDAVKAGKGVDWPSLKRRLMRAGAGASLISNSVQVVRYAEKVYQVKIINHEAFAELCQFASPINKSSRSAASLSGNSHATSVDGALLIAYDSTSAEPYNYVLRRFSRIPCPPKKHAMIIENLECFLDFKSVYQFAVKHCGVVYPEEDIEFLWAAGNGISNRLVIPYLQLFSGSVLCVLDVDSGGIQIYANLLAGGLAAQTTRYLIPDDLGERLHRSRRKISSEDLDALSRLYGLSHQVDNIISVLRHYRTTVEQESYRAHG